MHTGTVYCHADPEVHLARRAAQLVELECSPEYVERVISDLRPRLEQVFWNVRRKPAA